MVEIHLLRIEPCIIVKNVFAGLISGSLLCEIEV